MSKQSQIGLFGTRRRGDSRGVEEGRRGEKTQGEGSSLEPPSSRPSAGSAVAVRADEGRRPRPLDLLRRGDPTAAADAPRPRGRPRATTRTAVADPAVGGTRCGVGRGRPRGQGGRPRGRPPRGHPRPSAWSAVPTAGRRFTAAPAEFRSRPHDRSRPCTPTGATGPATDHLRPLDSPSAEIQRPLERRRLT